MPDTYKIRKAEFIASAAHPKQYPPADRPEVAFAGRSNVGKSSLINGLLKRRKLARTSRTPGRTQTINFFDINDELFFVDLPGYGYAKVPLKVRAAWRPMVESYLSSPRRLAALVLIIDIRRDPGNEELDFISWLNLSGVAPLVVVTKADKISRGKWAGRTSAITKALNLPDEPFIYSAISGMGREAILDEIIKRCETAPE